MHCLPSIGLPAICIYTSPHISHVNWAFIPMLQMRKLGLRKVNKSGLTQLLSEKPRFFGPCSCSLKVITVPTVTLSSGRHRHQNGGSLVQPPASCSVCAPSEPLSFRKKAGIPKGYVCQQHSEIFFVIGMATNLQFRHF